FIGVDIAGQLFLRNKDNQLKNNPSRQTYSPEIKKFACTLSFYSMKAYDFVRKTFNFTLPSPTTLRNWYSTIDGAPGFTDESFKCLKALALKNPDNRIICTLILMMLNMTESNIVA
ncbi:Uncharacterized protein FKW44_012237, partial [Caligus rogercresseyi]